MNEVRTLVCFAVKEEARFFRRRVSGTEVQILLTGMGPRNAERTIHAWLAKQRPALVLSAGFAGGLRPGLSRNTVLFDTEEATLAKALSAARAQPGTFACVPRVVTTVREKRGLFEMTGADAVEMESAVIRTLCHQQQIPNAMVRVVLDTADKDLPLDFNALLTAGYRLHAGKLALALAKSPGKIASLFQLRRHSTRAARRLAEVLVHAVAAKV
jgi:adenosylhomocysteine nucleosidase